ncbi:hypothetical protein WH95_11345 [Kiloniella litopenaei]|uniref:Uncharacterized protein n=1 Tax=Kiloniella litopenaei TaxID=1549748 RepID=A0A0M2RAT4_9PROT|nr:hypothetical protein [Kiloniella litopenaei]KKJ76723.1 hypothetical protein WH95_11345 [Kiloniella litopenaei]
MNRFKKIFLGASAVALGVSVIATNAVFAASSGNSEYVQNVDLSFPGYAAVINVKNTSGSKSVNNVNLQVQESSIEIEADGFVQCGDNKKITFKEAKIYFGPVSMFVDDINDNGALYQSDYEVSHKSRIGLGKWMTEGTNGNESFIVPLNQIKNGHPAVRVNPLEEINKKLQAHLQGGGTKVDFYQNDQEIVLQRPVSLAGWCRKYLAPGNNPWKAGFETQNFTIQVKYKGDPEITDKPILNAQLGQVGNNPQFNNNQPLLLNQATFQPNMPHHIGKCTEGTPNPKIRVNYKGSGKGTVRFKIAVKNSEGNFVLPNIYLGSYDSENQINRHFDFDYPLIDKMYNHHEYKWWKMINKTYEHDMTIQAQVKDQNSDSYGSWVEFGSATFKHRCTPQVIVNGGNATLGGYQNQGNDDTQDSRGILQKKPQRAPLGKTTGETDKPKRLIIRTPQ